MKKHYLLTPLVALIILTTLGGCRTVIDSRGPGKVVISPDRVVIQPGRGNGRNGHHNGGNRHHHGGRQNGNCHNHARYSRHCH